jgi:nicotinamidase-related amidase
MASSTDFSRTAVIIMDYQPAILRVVKEGKDDLVKRARGVLDAYRKAGARIIYVNVGFRPGYPEVGERNKRFSAAKQNGALKAGPDCDPDPAIAPKPDDVTMVKRRFGAFAGNDLELILRANNIETLVLLGVSTSGCVLSTVRHAADADYRLIVVRDCCADGDMALHDILCDKVFPSQAEVVTAESLLQNIA